MAKMYTPEYCRKRARACDLLARETVQEEARNRLRELAAQWRALADDGEQAPAVGCEQLEEDMHIDVTA